MMRRKFEDAYRLHQTGDLEAAKRLYEEILVTDPQHLDALHLLGLLFHEVGSLPDAERVFLAAVQIKADFSPIYLSYARTLFDLRRCDEAFACYEMAVALSPNDPHAYADRGLFQQSMKRTREALADFDKALLIESNYPLAHNNRGITLANLGRIEDAIQSYDEAIKYDPTNALAHANKASALKAMDRAEEAIKSYDVAISYDRDHGNFHFNKANSLIYLNRIDEAVQSLNAAIERDPQHAEAYFSRANALFLSNAFSESIADYNIAIILHPNYPEVYTSRGEALKNLNLHDEALMSFNEAIKLNPGFSSAYYNKGNLLNTMGLPEEALTSYARASASNPKHAETYHNKAILLRRLNRLMDAMESYELAIAANPYYPEALLNYGIILMETGRTTEALECYDRAIAAKPDFAEAYSNQGLLNHGLKNYGKALQHYQKAFLIKQNSPETFLNLGVTLMAMQQHDDALTIFEKAISLKPEYSHAYTNRALALKDSKRFEQALASCDQALVLTPDSAEGHNNRGVILKELNRHEAAFESFQNAMRISPRNFNAHSNLLFTMNYVDHLPEAARMQEAIRYGENVARQASHEFTEWATTDQSAKCKIGFVSGDFQNHPVGYFLEGLLSQLDRNKFDLIGYSTDLHEDDLTSRIKKKFNIWRSIYGQPDSLAAKIIHDDGVHILIDLSGHTAKNRLPIFAFKPAPVQISWLGYFATTGVRQIDYILGDPYVTPANEEHQFSEKIKRLPETYLCFTPPQSDVRVGPLPAIENGYITFGSFNNFSKVNTEVIALWGHILQTIAGSRLFLKAGQFRDSDLVRSVTTQFASLGVSTERLTFEGQTDRGDYLKAYNKVDIALDPFPYPGGTTSVEGLWMGVPVITKKGNRFIGHNGETIAHNSGQSNWIAADDEEYIKKAVLYSSDFSSLALIRAGLRDQLLASPLCNSVRFARHFENAMNEIWTDFLKWRSA